MYTGSAAISEAVTGARVPGVVSTTAWGGLQTAGDGLIDTDDTAVDADYLRRPAAAVGGDRPRHAVWPPGSANGKRRASGRLVAGGGGGGGRALITWSGRHGNQTGSVGTGG